MIHQLISKNLLPSRTPYFLIDKEKLKNKASFHKKIAEESKVKVIYSLKTFSHIEPLKEIAKCITGFSTSSLFEAKLAKQLSNNKYTIHFVSPGIQYSQWNDISELIHFMTFNSLEQLTRLQNDLHSQVSYGIRINPEISFTKNNRYNPCGLSSKQLGVPLSDMLEFLKSSKLKNKLTGLHFHNNHYSFDISEMKKTFHQIESSLGEYLNHFHWINLGGGYTYNQENISDFYKLIEHIKQKYNFKQIIIEPGASFVKECVSLVSSVIDIFQRDGQSVAILDTTINHLPEILEHQFPLVSNTDTSGVYKYLLSGRSCFAGDLFGSHSFKNPLEIGSKIIFKEVGSYSLVKSHFFNGINLPDIYYLEDNKNIREIKVHVFEDYIKRCGG